MAGTELERAYADRNAALEASRTGVCLFAGDGSVRFANSAFRELMGLAADAEITWPAFLELIGGELERGRTHEIRRGVGVVLAVRLTAIGPGELLASVDDVTLHERERTARSRFMAEVVEAQERSSRRVAELLHEDAVQALTALALRLELSAELAGGDELRDLAAAASDITRSLRRLIVELHPAVLESQGLAAGIETSAEALRDGGVEVAISAFDARLRPETELLAYRIVQEALENALRHARSSRVEVDVSLVPGLLRCHVHDDGVGFDTASLEGAVRNRRLGLSLARERAEIAGGSHRVESRPGHGTTVYFELPLEAEEGFEAAKTRGAA